MSTTSLAYGFIPSYHPTGQTRASKYTIATGYGTSIYKGDPVVLNTNGTITISAGNDDILGVFAGCEYIDANGKPTESPYWPASTSATNIVAYVYDDALNVFQVGVTANASGYVQAVVGDQANASIAAGSTATGVSGTSIATAAVGAGVQGQWRVIGFADGIYDATNNPYPQLLVQIARHQFVAVKVAI